MTSLEGWSFTTKLHPQIVRTRSTGFSFHRFLDPPVSRSTSRDLNFLDSNVDDFAQSFTEILVDPVSSGPLDIPVKRIIRNTIYRDPPRSRISHTRTLAIHHFERIPASGESYSNDGRFNRKQGYRSSFKQIRRSSLDLEEQWGR